MVTSLASKNLAHDPLVQPLIWSSSYFVGFASHRVLAFGVHEDISTLIC